MTAGIRLLDVTVTYDRQPAVHRITGCFAAGSTTAITGPNGAGKSTLLKAIMGQLRPSGGSIDSNGLRIRDFGYLPQAADINRSFPICVRDMVLLGAWASAGAFGGIKRAVEDALSRALCSVGLEGFETRPIGSLSAGQFQRVLFARLLLQNARVIILDEPFNAIDARTTEDLLAIIQRWKSEDRTVIAVLHDFDQVRMHFPQTLLLARETIAWGETRESMTAANLLRARAMAESWDARPERTGRARRMPA